MVVTRMVAGDEKVRAGHSWWNVAAHLSAAAFVALVAYSLLLRANFLFDGDFLGWIGWWPVFVQTNFGCEAPLPYLREPRQPEIFADAVCWDASHDRVRIAAVLLVLMVSAWAARAIARSRQRGARPYELVFIGVGLTAIVGDWFLQWPWWSDLLSP